MTRDEVNQILNAHKKATSYYEKKLFELCKLRYDMQGVSGTDYTKLRVQGGEKSCAMVDLIDKEIKLSKAVQEALIKKSEAYEGAMKLIYLLSNKDNACDVLGDIYLLNKSYCEVAKTYHYDINSLWNKVSKEKNRLVQITTAKGLEKEDFLEKF